jgi:hypothetical protein
LVVVIDQIDQRTRQFDEHKVMIGWPNRGEAVAAYRANYDAGWVVGHTTVWTMPQFVKWLDNGDHTQPAGAAVHAIVAALEESA